MRQELEMVGDNIVYVDFRFSKDIRAQQLMSFRERIKESSARTRQRILMSKTALEVIRLMFEQDDFFHRAGPNARRDVRDNGF